MSRNKISSLPDIGKLDSLPMPSHDEEELIFLEHLSQLDLTRNFLISLPTWLFGVPQLISSLIGVPDCGSGVKKPGQSRRFAPYLSSLRVAGNRIRAVPRQMWLAPCLESFDVSENSIMALPSLSLDEVALATRSRTLGRSSVYVDTLEDSKRKQQKLMTRGGVSVRPANSKSSRVTSYSACFY